MAFIRVKYAITIVIKTSWSESALTSSGVEGIVANGSVTVVNVRWFGSDALELTYKTSSGKVGNEIKYTKRYHLVFITRYLLNR